MNWRVWESSFLQPILSGVNTLLLNYRGLQKEPIVTLSDVSNESFLQEASRIVKEAKVVTSTNTTYSKGYFRKSVEKRGGKGVTVYSSSFQTRSLKTYTSVGKTLTPCTLVLYA